jgi:hypothetical protein
MQEEGREQLVSWGARHSAVFFANVPNLELASVLFGGSLRSGQAGRGLGAAVENTSRVNGLVINQLLALPQF